MKTNNNYPNFRENMILSKIENKVVEVAANAIKTRFTIPIRITSNSI